MTTVKADLSISLDGYVAGPDDGPDQPLGRGGEQLHEWIFGLASWRERHGYEGGAGGVDSDVIGEAFAGVGAVAMGRRMFELGAPHWGEEPPFRVPMFVVTRAEREPVVRGATTFTFVSDGVERAVSLARKAAGGGDVSIAGGAQVVRGALAAGLLDELQVHVVPVVLGGGAPLFAGLDPARVRFEQVRAVAGDDVTHLLLRVLR